MDTTSESIFSELMNFRNQIPPESLSDWSFIDNPPPRIIFERRKFCLTGEFAIGQRSKIAQWIEHAGGICVNSVLKDLDFLIIGVSASGGWSHATLGNKIIKAISERERRALDRIPGPALVSEIHFAQEMLKAMGAP